MKDTSGQLITLTFCNEKAQEYIDELLSQLRDRLLRATVQTSMEPLVQRFRSLNGRLTALLQDYSQLVNHFFTFSFRLGDTVIPEHD